MSAIWNYPVGPAAAGLEGTKNSAKGTPAAPEGDGLANKEVFLQLLVAQLQNQNPMNPSDPIQFLTQLAQFTNLEQSLGMKEELKGIREAVEFLAGAAKVAQDDAGQETGGSSGV
jgi:flagellar basal-body rod modification protein FlgD